MATITAPVSEIAPLKPVAISLSTRKLILIGLAALLTVVLLRTAWVAEDAYISYRTLDNFLHGYGLRWNIDDRVQTYTDPLFLGMMTIATAISGNVYLATIALSLALTLIAFFLITWNSSETGIITAATAFLFSKAFMDFSISGLENPATQLALAAYTYCFWKKRGVLALSLIAALAATNRMDTVLFFLPSLIAVYARGGVRRIWKQVLLGWSPFLAWSAFSLFYYGFLFPNTAYAKLNTGIPTRDVIFQGVIYCLNAVTDDPATIVVILLGIIVAYYSREWLLGLGIVLNLLYVVRVGGDFMGSRFFSASLFLSVAILARHWRPRPVLAGITLLLIAGVAMWGPSPTILSANAEFGQTWPVDLGGIADERAFYYKSSGLLRYKRNTLWPEMLWSAMGQSLKLEHKKVAIFSNIGFHGYWAGPTVHIIDPLALGDAFIARLPMAPGAWRIGHFRRDLPAGYVETYNTGTNQIVDPHLHEYFDHLHLVISGDLWSLERFKQIFLFNIGYYEHLIPRAK